MQLSDLQWLVESNVFDKPVGLSQASVSKDRSLFNSDIAGREPLLPWGGRYASGTKLAEGLGELVAQPLGVLYQFAVAGMRDGERRAEPPIIDASQPLAWNEAEQCLIGTSRIPYAERHNEHGRPTPHSAPHVTLTSKIDCRGWHRRSRMTAMGTRKMHADEIQTYVALVRRLIAGQFPQWADLRMEPVVSYGTDHDIYRLGDHLAVRLPRIGWATGQAAKEAQWLPKLAPHLPLAVPVQVATGDPAEGYPFIWSVYEWLPGENANGTIHDLDQAAVDLAAFVKALRQVDTAGAHPRLPHARGGPLAEGDEHVRQSIAHLGDRIDGDAALRSWQESLSAPAWENPEVWVHGDLLPGNLLVVEGRLSAVIDFGGLNVGDPACDLQPAWNVFAGDSRLRFRAELCVDDASWLRGRGWALCQAVTGLAYYWDTNPGMVRQTAHALAQVLADSSL